MKPKQPISYPALLRFREISKSSEKEYVVIATEGPVEDHAIGGFEFSDVAEIDNVDMFPTDVPLWPKP